MPTFTLRWTSFNFVYPPTFNEEDFHAAKYILQKTPKDFMKPPLNFFHTFKSDLRVLVWGSVICAVCVVFENSVTDWIALIVGLITFGAFISFVPSIVSFITNHYYKLKYFKKLKTAIINSSNYHSFCVLFAQTDLRYYKLVNS